MDKDAIFGLAVAILLGGIVALISVVRDTVATNEKATTVYVNCMADTNNALLCAERFMSFYK